MSDHSENYIILKGCTDPYETGEDMYGRLTIHKFMTPATARKSGPITISMWADFDEDTYELSNKIFEKSSSLPKEMFIQGQLTVGAFTAIRPIVQEPTSHQILFTTESPIPPNLVIDGEVVFKYRILVKYPTELTLWERKAGEELMVQDLTG
jgi:hypothetical protein